MAVSLNTNSLLSYNDWLKYENTLNPKNYETAYFEYVQEWYKNKKNNDSDTVNIKSQFIQLVKDLSFLFANSETNDIFLKNLDYNNDEELIYAIPFFAKKLRQIAVVLQKKRENVKLAKLKYNLIGSNDGLEKLLYEYILKGFTNTENSITQVPASPLINYFPDLSAIKDNFYIELEELYDTKTYFDSDPSVDIKNYLNVDDISDLSPYNELNYDEINALLSTRFLSRIAETPLSNIFKDYVLTVPTLSTASLSANFTNLIYNQINASKKYLGEPVYGLTAVRLKDVDKPDLIFNLNFSQGNNWFYWPSGNKVLNDSIFNNIYEPININNSNLIISGATGGTDYKTSDLIFTDKNGSVEGAWLKGPNTDRLDSEMYATINGATTKDFIFPFPGIVTNSKSLTFQNYSINDENNFIIEKLSPEVREQVLKSYFTSTLPNTGCNSIYINQTNLINNGAHASNFSPEADNIIKKQKQNSDISVYTETDNGSLEQAYLYKFDKTDIPISTGLNKIHWPILTYDSTQDSPITIQNDTCLPITLSELNPSQVMAGAIAGSNFNNSDVIYKFNSKNGDVIEAAWLGSGSINNLDTQHNSIPVYNTPATKCSEFIDGQVQPSLSFIANGSEKVSFVWMDSDTPADEVFKFVQHLPSCPYKKSSPHNFHKDQDYQNINPLNSLHSWTNCDCKSVQYSPIGHSGNFVSEYNGMADYLFVDPDGLGQDFALNSWTDTRGLDPNNSPQFAFYKIIDGDTSVGWGDGYWKTGNNSKFILKTGKRYTYYRSSLRKDSSFTSTNVSPYFICNYPYKNIHGIYSSNEVYDLAVLVDISRSQSNSINNVKSVVLKTIDKILTNNKNVQISLITFGTKASRVSWLTNYEGKETLELFANALNVPQDPDLYQTNIADALDVAKAVLTTSVVSQAITDDSFSLKDLCSRLGYSIFLKTYGAGTADNTPNPNSKKKILIFSDGVDNISYGLTPYYADVAKYNGIEIYGVNVGELQDSQDLIKNISSSLSYYFNLQNFLVSGDGDTDSFAEYISNKLGGNYSIKPFWYKAYRNSNGDWVGSNELSNLVIYPGDFIGYVHRAGSYYTCPNNSNSNFITPSISFTLNAKLDGWDYLTNTFSADNRGFDYGGKPFWAKVYTTEDSINNFYKGTISFGGHIRYYDDYVPLHQPEISSMILNAGDNIQYVRNNSKQIIWNEPLTFFIYNSTYQWNKLNFTKDYSNLADFLRSGKIDGIVNDTFEPSDLTLESYSSFKPAYYNYYARNSFTYTENLYDLNRCLNSFVVYNTGLVIDPVEPYAHLTNVHYPTVATISFPSDNISLKQVGNYFTPEKLGTPYFRGKGYTFEIDNDSLTYIDSISAERLFLDINKYSSRHRGLTKKDQITPIKISNISNDWMMEPYSSGEKGGVMINTKENQKLIPYQTSYEIYNKNHYGIARQDDVFQFWTPPIPGTWNDSTNYPLTLRQELPAAQYNNRLEKLLVDKGSLTNWRTDIFGNQYGLYKKFSPLSLQGIYMWFSADYGVIHQVTEDAFTPDIFADTSLNKDVVKWLDRSGKNNNLFLSKGNPQLYVDKKINNKRAIYFDQFSSLTNNFNINTSEATMFIVGSYVNSNNAYASNTYQVMASFGAYLTASTIDFISDNQNSLVFANSYGNFTFNFGNNIGYINLLGDRTYSITLSSSTFDNTNSFYTFETIFKSPSALSYINGNLYADNLGITDGTGDLNYFNSNLYSNGGFSIGSFMNNTLGTECSISEIIFYNRALSDNERKLLEIYLRDKYSIY